MPTPEAKNFETDQLIGPLVSIDNIITCYELGKINDLSDLKDRIVAILDSTKHEIEAVEISSEIIIIIENDSKNLDELMKILNMLRRKLRYKIGHFKQ